MAKSKRKRAPKTVLKLPDLEQSKSAVLNSLTSASSKRSYDHAICEFVDWYCSEPRLAFNRLWLHGTGSRSNSTHTPRRRSTSDWPRYADWRMKRPIADSSVLTSWQAYGA